MWGLLYYIQTIQSFRVSEFRAVLWVFDCWFMDWILARINWLKILCFPAFQNMHACKRQSLVWVKDAVLNLLRPNWGCGERRKLEIDVGGCWQIINAIEKWQLRQLGGRLIKNSLFDQPAATIIVSTGHWAGFKPLYSEHWAGFNHYSEHWENIWPESWFQVVLKKKIDQNWLEIMNIVKNTFGLGLIYVVWKKGCQVNLF